MSRALLLVSLLAVSSVSSGCSSTAAPNSAAPMHPWLGSNVAPRESTERPMWAKVLLYVPDRLLDLGDVFSFDVHLGVGLLANVHATRAIQMGAGLREVAGFGWHERRSLGFQIQGDANMLLPGIGAEASHVGTLGTSGINSASEATAGLIEPSDALYQNYRDYWAVGGQVTLLFVGVDFDLHPVQLADFAMGWAGIDFLHDDFARTRSRTAAERAPVPSMESLDTIEDVDFESVIPGEADGAAQEASEVVAVADVD